MQLTGTIFRNRSLWYKFTLLSVLPVIFATAFISFKMVGSVERTLVHEAEKKADALIDLIQVSLSHALVIDNPSLLDEFVDGLGGMAGVNYAMVVTIGDNRILSATDHRLDGQPFGEISPDGRYASAGAIKSLNPLGPAPQSHFSESVPIVIGDKPYAFLQIGYSFKEVHQGMAAMKKSILLVALLTVLAGVALALVVAKLISAPIRCLADQARQAGEGDFSQALVYKSTDAIGVLADAFNRMLADIHAKQRQLKTINTIANAVYQSLDIQTVARNAVDTIMEYSHADGGVIFTVDDRRKRLALVHAQGFEHQILKKVAAIPLEGSITGEAVKDKQIVFIKEITSDPRLNGEVRQALIDGHMNSALSVPLLARNRVLGAINLLFKTSLTLSSHEHETLMSIGKTVGLAMDNAHQMSRVRVEVQERKETEIALRKSEEDYRNLIERANDGILIIQDGRIRFANPCAVALSGQPPAEFLNQPFTDYLHPEEKEKVREMYAKRITKGKMTAIYETIFIRQDGKRIYAEVNGNRTVYKERPADLVIIRDISKRKQAQEALRRAYGQLEVKVAERTAELAIAKDRAEESDRLKSAFLAAMSHELRTPLNSIIGFTGIILQQLVGPLTEEQAKQLTMVQESAYHLLSLINDVLDLSKIEAGQLNITLEPFEMQAAIDKVVQAVSPMAEEKGLPINVHLGPHVGTLNSDRRRVEQILLNLLNNAIKFTSKGQIWLRCEANRNRIITSVKDTGIGIATDDSKKLFKAFQQIETGLSRRFEGSGLGLSICRKLVELLGGEIDAHSEGLGQGAVFTFTLPAVETRP